MQDLKSNLLLFLKTLINCSPNNFPAYSVPLCVAFAEVRVAVGSLHQRRCLCGGSPLLLGTPLQPRDTTSAASLLQLCGPTVFTERLRCLGRLLHRPGLTLIIGKNLIGFEKDLDPLVMWTLLETDRGV